MDTGQKKNKKALRIGRFSDVCPSHKPKLYSYIKRSEWAEYQASKGIKQKQCKKCRHWFFPSEF